MKLPRPNISIYVRCCVVLRQIGTIWPEDAINARRRTPGGLRVYLSEILVDLAGLLGCEVNDLRLDHIPALALRKKVFRDGIHVDYEPPCDSADDLLYRTHLAHLVKTNHAGDHGQHPDRVLIKKQRRREREAEVALGLRKLKPKAVIRSANRWPAKGARKINWRKP